MICASQNKVTNETAVIKTMDNMWQSFADNLGQ